MNKIVFGFFLFALDLFFALETNAQHFKIINAEDGAALQFATLINYTHPNLISANINGLAEMSAQNGDSIAVSYVGFKTTSFIYHSNTPETIRLFKNAEDLAPIIVHNCSKVKTFKYTNKNEKSIIKKKDTIYHYNGIEWWGINWEKPPVWAVRLNPKKENATLKDFSFWLEKSFWGPESATKAPLIIGFYDVTDSILPGNLLTEKPLIYYPQKTGKQTLNLDSFHFRIPPNGIYISFQCVMIEEYKWTQKIRINDSTKFHLKDTSVTAYGGRIKGVCTKNFEFATFNPLKNKWILLDLKSPNDDYLHGSVKCEAVIKYCKD